MAKFSDPVEPSPPSMAQSTVTVQSPTVEQFTSNGGDQVRLAEIALENRRLDELKEKRDNESFFRSGWRPAMSWMYMGICIFDFVIGPFFYAWFAYYTKDFAKFGEWQPLTLMGGGVFHAAMGAILGVTSWTRGQYLITQEKMTSVNSKSPGQ